MTSTTSVLDDVTFVAVNVHARDSAFGCKLHAHTPVVSLLPQLRDQFLSRCDGDEPLREYLTGERIEWALEHGPIRERINPESTLDEAGITAPPAREPLPDIEKHEVRLVTWMAVKGTRGQEETLGQLAGSKLAGELF